MLRSHAIRNAMLPVVTILGMDLGLALGGAFFTETVYGLPGSASLRWGRSATSTCRRRRGWSCSPPLCIITFNLVVDTLYAWIDPRIRLT